SGAPLELARALASLIRFEGLKAVIEADRATVTSTVVLPNANDPAIQDLFLGFDEERLAALSPAERTARLDQLPQMARNGRLPVIVGEHEQWELIREDGSWRVFLNWAGALIVRFEGITKAGLPWEFTPVQLVVRAKPGETLQVFYRVKNLADRRITGKARHIMDPPEETGYLEIVTAFCFLQQTLNPAEGQELLVVFRVNPEIPESIREIRVRYEFYPLDRFPSSSGSTSKLGSLPENP
ncbi:MAG: cytochrome c oxidase assembly protein, partial [Nitrososphaera sp.]